MADAQYAERQAQNREKIEARRSLYRTPEWRRLRAAFISANPACIQCGNPATHVDHIRPHRGDQMLFLDWDNLQSLCVSCHGRKTAKYDGGFGNKRKTE